MNFQLSAEQKMIQESVRLMSSRHFDPLLKAHDANRSLPKHVILEIFRLCAEQGLTSPRLPESAGGSGISMLDYGLMIEQLPTVVAMAIISQEVTVARIFHESTDEQRERFLPDLIAGKKIACTASSEPGTGSDPNGVATRIVEKTDCLVVSGRKVWITNASVCDLINITGVADGNHTRKDRLLRVVVDRAESGFQVQEIAALGLRQGHLSEVLFDECRVPKFNLLGKPGDAARVLTLTWLVNRPLLGLCATRMAQVALDVALKYSEERSQFGRTINSFQLVQKLLADVAAAVTTSRLLCYHALSCIDSKDRANHISAMAKRYSVTACQRAISLAMEVCGAMGVSSEMCLEQLFRDVRMLSIPDGTNQILALIEGRELTGRQAYRT